MKIKRFLRVTAFLAVLAALLALLSSVLVTRKVMGGVYCEPLNTLEYIAVGDSECLAGVSPMELWKDFGYTGYNCGVPAQRMQDAYYELKNILRFQTPKVVLLETNMIFRDLGYIHEAKSFVRSLAYRLFPITRYHSLWKSWIFPKLNDAAEQSGTTFKGVHYNTQIQSCDPSNPSKKSEYGSEILPQQRYYLDRITALCKKTGIQLILFTVPTPVNWSPDKHDSIQRYAQEKSLPFWDLNDSTAQAGIDWSTDTYDGGDHMNFYGAKKVTAWLGRHMSGSCGLSDRRGNEWYAFWNDELTEYLNFTNQS